MREILNTAEYSFTMDGDTSSTQADCLINVDDMPTITMTKTSNKEVYKSGDAVTYTINITIGDSCGTIDSQRIVDNLPDDLVYIANSLTIDGEASEYTPDNIVTDFEPNSTHEIKYICAVK